MSSEESDDEPLSKLAAIKKTNPDKFAAEIFAVECSTQPTKKRIKKSQQIDLKGSSLTINFGRKPKPTEKPFIQRPEDVWLYLKDLNPTGPYSCLLCPEWFVNRAKIVVHYVLNHKKDFCGICRYFVADKESWAAHMKFHTPWPCSQCVENFPTELELRHHLSVAHNLVHCRLCHFRLPDNEQYHTHLFQKHNVTNVSSRNKEILWDLESDGSQKFLCLLCTKSNNLSTAFASHYMGYHHFTLKCLTSMISETNPPFMVFGAEISADFIEGLKNEGKCGYIDLDQKPTKIEPEDNVKRDTNILKGLLADIKVEVPSDNELVKNENGEKDDTEIKSKWAAVKSYKGDEDFDVTLMELIVLQKPYFDYLNRTLTDINSNVVSEISEVDYDKAKVDAFMEVVCELCSNKYLTVNEFSAHIHKMHCVKTVPIYSCRVCATTFDTQNELDSHVTEELGDFEDLWLCQFCEDEFDNRQSTRRHLTEHWDVIEYDNCFSPHLGFKCKFCPILFWNELDRENHHVKVHFLKFIEQYYKCQCNEIFSDKIWFTYHYLEKHHADDMSPAFLFKCCLCAEVLSSVEVMRGHFTDEHPEARKIFCSLDYCQYKPFSHKKSFQLHLRGQHGRAGGCAGGACACATCGREFPTPRARSAHVAQAHGGGRYKCKICPQLLHSMDERKLHYLLRHPGHHPYECTVCGKSFQYKSSLYIHKHEHSPNKQSYTCNYCQKVFAKKDSFREHLQIHEGPRHACSYCPMRFVQRSNMLRHERRHTGERPYACPTCRRAFSDKGACTAHLRTHSKQPSYGCLYCGQTFAQKSKLTYHIRKHTGENLETCKVCSKLFTSPCSLREHMKTHDVKKNDSVHCPLCNKTYRDERYMLRHLRTTHAANHLPCPLCQKSFSNNVSLRHHVLTHSRVNIFRCKLCPKSYQVRRTIVKHLRRRHALKNGEVNLRDFYKRLDPRECKLNLDEEALTSIFGPPKKVANDVLIGDYVTFTNASQLRKKNKKVIEANDDEEEEDEENDDEEENNSDNDNNDDDEDDDEGESGDEVGTKKDDGTVKTSEREEELEPTDFVSVKIEPMDEDEDSN